MTQLGAFGRSPALTILSLSVLVIAWQLASSILSIPKFLLPSPIDVIHRAGQFGPAWAPHILATIKSSLLGFALAVGVGFALAVGMVRWPFASRVLTPLIVVLQIVPKVAFAPLFLIWLGTGLLPIVVITFLVSFFPIVVNATVGFQDVERDLLDLTRILHLHWTRVFWSVRLPNALPQIFSGLRIASTLAVIGTIIGEFVGSNVGLGYLIVIANNQVDTPLAFAAIIIVSAFGLGLYALVLGVERVCMPWRRSLEPGSALSI